MPRWLHFVGLSCGQKMIIVIFFVFIMVWLSQIVPCDFIPFQYQTYFFHLNFPHHCYSHALNYPSFLSSPHPHTHPYKLILSIILLTLICHLIKDILVSRIWILMSTKMIDQLRLLMKIHTKQSIWMMMIWWKSLRKVRIRIRKLLHK